ncbi:sperm-associated antigen 8-like [Littorina saxatilis]|uniref:Sperm-associated antigen 8 n=1 Tax=Littorina saxatilis TaxID=31220 RepID=A0AAN9C4V5_9CAEN
MSVLNDGRNEIRVNNSDGKCLLENWVEERSVKHLDPDIKLENDVTSKLQILRHGHKGLITTDLDAKAEDKTTVRVTYTPPVLDSTRQVGSKKELLEKMLFGQVCKEMKGSGVGMDPGPKPTDFRSIKMVDYDFKFEPQKIAPTRDHNYRKEQPVTFWSEHKEKIHGTTQVKTRDSAFRRNDAFSKPIGEYWNETEPYQLENYPKM